MDYVNNNKENFKIKLQSLRNKFGEKYKIRAINKKYLIWAGVIIGALIVILIGLKVMSSSASSSNSQAQVSTLEKTDIKRNFDFPILDDKGKEVGKISYELTSAELDKNILVQGKFATAVKGKLFFVVNIKLTNNQDKGISINTKDYLRLSVNGDTKELLAPSLHNDPVTVQPISIQYSRLGFVVTTEDENFVLQVGEIKGSKQKIEVNF